MTTLLAEHNRTARKVHQCSLCLHDINPGDAYLEQRLVDGGAPYNLRQHHACQSAFWSWFIDYDEPTGTLQEASEGHLPPCWHAWCHDVWRYNRFEPFIGPRPSCVCEPL